MAAATAAQTSSFGSKAFDKVEQNLSEPVSLFDPSKHLCFEQPKDNVMLKDLGLSEENAISPLAITAPFPLFTLECVRRMREEMFQKKIIEGYSQRMEPGCYTLRGFTEHAPFLESVWRSPEVMDAISAAAGVDLDVIFEYEMGHINVQVEGLTDETPLTSMIPPAMPQPHPALTTLEEAEKAHAAQLSAAGPWHKDCYPWVIIIMLSDTTNMIGGETGLRKGDGTVVKQRGPGVGWAYVLQGGCVEHIALKSFGGERIAMVTSFRPRDPMQLDLSHLGGVKGNSNWDPLFKQWSLYRLGVMEQRINILREKLRKENLTYTEISKAMLEWNEGMYKYMEHTAAQMK
ncbi:hypothetical protein A1O1_04547 [Capronia coronata CBS 617.96]|uniref:Fe2OG dioxygenase domain-containing protein n=1 Tax=Capronia coronata CBS 617.96 TaxID=1182541 RepID=W9YP55_9EURO|nr:uncharacterized protein A1O1_04547 [Capronia coronata CBS 617.96]EXJ91435.1 hypothetical protein A1O1_04547 [Capronia coronata CBS 617.96]